MCLAAVLFYAEKGFKRIKGYASIPDVIRNIEAEEENNKMTWKIAAQGKTMRATQTVSTKNLTFSNYMSLKGKKKASGQSG